MKGDTQSPPAISVKAPVPRPSETEQLSQGEGARRRNRSLQIRCRPGIRLQIQAAEVEQVLVKTVFRIASVLANLSQLWKQIYGLDSWWFKQLWYGAKAVFEKRHEPVRIYFFTALLFRISADRHGGTGMLDYLEDRIFTEQRVILNRWQQESPIPCPSPEFLIEERLLFSPTC